MITLSWIDFYYLTIEFKEKLLGSRIDNFYGTRDELHIKLYKAGQKNLVLSSFISKGVTILNTNKNEHNPRNNFIQYLRKYISNGFIDDIISYEKERIVTIKISKKSKDDDSAQIYYIHFEHFMGGQIYFCNSKQEVLKSLKPISNDEIKNSKSYNLKLENEILNNFKFEDLNISLQDNVKKLGIGKKYISIINEKFNLENTQVLQNLEKDTITEIEKFIQNLLSHKLNPQKINKILSPFEINLEEVNSSNLSFSQLLFEEYKKELISSNSPKEPIKITKLKKRLEQQEKSLKKINKQNEELQEKGSLYYEEYQLISEFQEKVKQIVEKNGFKELKSKIKANEKLKQIITQVDEKNQKISINLEELKKIN